MRKPDFCICQNKGADQLCSNCLCFRYWDSTISLLPKSKISSLKPSSMTVQASLCQTTLLVFSRCGTFVTRLGISTIDPSTSLLKPEDQWSYKSSPEIWDMRPCHKIGQGHPGVMIYINFVGLHSLMLQAKFQNHRSSGSEE